MHATTPESGKQIYQEKGQRPEESVRILLEGITRGGVDRKRKRKLHASGKFFAWKISDHGSKTGEDQGRGKRP